MTISFLLPVILTVTLASATWEDCQLPCICKWVEGKKSALCIDGNLTSIPTTLETDMQVLNLSQNHIKTLRKDVFTSSGLINLQKISLANNELTEINPHTFKNLDLLYLIDLSNNALTNLDPLLFENNIRLRSLILSGNPLKKLNQNQFSLLPHLEELDLERCQIEYIHESAFVHLISLRKLNLQHNHLETLSVETFKHLRKLWRLLFDGNPWKCDCHLRKLRNWYVDNHLQANATSCSLPKQLNGRLWKELSDAEFVCSPKVSVSPQGDVRVEAGASVTLSCHITGDPEPQVSWLFEDNPIDHSWPIIRAEGSPLDKWVNISISKVDKADFGLYTCTAKNAIDTVAQNVNLV